MDMINNYCSKVYSKWCGKFKCFIKPNNNIYIFEMHDDIHVLIHNDQV